MAQADRRDGAGGNPADAPAASANPAGGVRSGAALAQLLAMLKSPRDEDKFVALLLIPRVADAGDAATGRQIAAAMDWTFLARLLATPLVAPKDTEKKDEAVGHWRVAATVAAELAPFAAQAPGDAPASVLPGLLGMLRKSAEAEPWVPLEPPKANDGKADSDDEEVAEAVHERKPDTAEDAASPAQAPLQILAASALADLLTHLPAAFDFLCSNLLELASVAVLRTVQPEAAVLSLDLASRVLLLCEHGHQNETNDTKNSNHTVHTHLASPPLGHHKPAGAADLLSLVLPKLATDLTTSHPPHLLSPSIGLLSFLHKPYPSLQQPVQTIISLLLLRSRARRAESEESKNTFRMLSLVCEIYGPQFWTWSTASESNETKKMPSGGQALAIAIGVVAAEIRVLLELIDDNSMMDLSLDDQDNGGSSSSSSPRLTQVPLSKGGSTAAAEDQLPHLLPLFTALVDALLNPDLSLPVDTLLPLRRTLSEAFLAVAAFLAERRDQSQGGQLNALESPVVEAALDALGRYLREEEEAEDMRETWIEIVVELCRRGKFPIGPLSVLAELLEEGDKAWREGFEEARGWEAVAAGLLKGPSNENFAGSILAWDLFVDEIARHEEKDRSAPAPSRGTHLILPKGVSASVAAQLARSKVWINVVPAACCAALLLAVLWELYPDERREEMANEALDWICGSLLHPTAEEWPQVDRAMFHLSRCILGYPHLARLLSSLPLSRKRTMPLLGKFFAHKRFIGPWLPIAIAKRGSTKGRQLVIDVAGGTLKLGKLVKAENGWEGVLHAVGHEGHSWERNEEGFYD